MIERKDRKPYWRHTKWQMLASLVPFLAALVTFPLYAEQLNAKRFLGFPLGYFLVCHGLILIGFVIIAFMGILLTSVAERLERRFSRWRPER